MWAVSLRWVEKHTLLEALNEDGSTAEKIAISLCIVFTTFFVDILKTDRIVLLQFNVNWKLYYISETLWWVREKIFEVARVCEVEEEQNSVFHNISRVTLQCLAIEFFLTGHYKTDRGYTKRRGHTGQAKAPLGGQKYMPNRRKKMSAATKH